MLALLVTLLAQDVPATKVVETRIETVTIATPMEITPLVWGYGDCLKAEIEGRNAAVPESRRSAESWQAALRGGFDACRALRAETAAKASKALPRDYGSKKQRAAIIEDALIAVEQGWGGDPAGNSEKK